MEEKKPRSSQTEQASRRQDEEGRRRGQRESMIEGTKTEGYEEGETDATESGASAMPREASAWLNFLLNYYFNRKDERR